MESISCLMRSVEFDIFFKSVHRSCRCGRSAQTLGIQLCSEPSICFQKRKTKCFFKIWKSKSENVMSFQGYYEADGAAALTAVPSPRRRSASSGVVPEWFHFLVTVFEFWRCRTLFPHWCLDPSHSGLYLPGGPRWVDPDVIMLLQSADSGQARGWEDFLKLGSRVRFEINFNQN